MATDETPQPTKRTRKKPVTNNRLKCASYKLTELALAFAIGIIVGLIIAIIAANEGKENAAKINERRGIIADTRGLK
jgi:hypothetical protein